MDKVVFLLAHARHARMWRRVNRVRTFFDRAEVLAYERNLETPAEHGRYESLGQITNGNYLARLRRFARACRLIRRATADATAVYCFSLDLLALAWIVSLTMPSQPRLAYEVADIREILARRGMVPAALRWAERFLIRRSAVVVLTSAHFHQGYFREVQRFTGFRHVVIEHKPELPESARDQVTTRTDWTRPLTVGYFGILKSPASFRLLIRLARESCGAVRVVFRGIFVPPLDAGQCIAEIGETAGARYDGPYKSPDDLPAVYGGVDMVWDAYNETANSQWQRTTRFSEALFFRRPVIVNPATQDGRLATQYGVGLCIDLRDEADAVHRIQSITSATYATWLENFARIPTSVIRYTNEYAQLRDALLGSHAVRPSSSFKLHDPVCESTSAPLDRAV